MDIDTTGWSGDGDFTIRLVEQLKAFDEIAGLRVEDAPASSAGAGYNFLANEIFVAFAAESRRVRRWRALPFTGPVLEPRLTLSGLQTRLAGIEGSARPTTQTRACCSTLRTERVVQPYQTRGYKMVELVRIYAVVPVDGSG